jgi:hypothetical protein
MSQRQMAVFDCLGIVIIAIVIEMQPIPVIMADYNNENI